MASLRIISFNWEVYNSTWNRTRYTCHSMFTIDTKYTHLIVINTKFVCYWAWWVCYANVVSINMRSHCVNVFRTCSFSRTGPRLLFCHTTTFRTQWNVNRDRFLNWILNCKTIFINCVHNGPAWPFVRRCKFVCSPNAAAALVNPQDELRVGIFNLFFCFFNLLFQTNSHNQSHPDAENSGETSVSSSPSDFVFFEQENSSRVPQLTCIWMSVGGRNPFTQSNLTLAASGAFKSSRTPQKIHF